MLSYSFTPFPYCVSNPDAPHLSTLPPLHCTLPSDRSILLPWAFFSFQHFNILTSVSTRYPSPWPPHRTLSYFLSNPRTSVLAKLYPGLSCKPQTSLQLQSPWLGPSFEHSTFSLVLFISILWLNNRGEAWRAGISFLEKKQTNTNWQAWILRVALWILGAALGKRRVQPCKTSH